MASSRWAAWHEEYEDPTSYLSARLSEVRRQVSLVLDSCAPGPLQAISLCAGQGRDLIGVLNVHPRASDVRARLIELDPDLAGFAAASAAQAGLDQVEVSVADAANSDSFVGAVPADLVMVCGVFGNISEQDIARTIAFLPAMCAPGARVVWTRHRRAPDLTGSIRASFERVGFVEEQFAGPDDFSFGVGTHRLAVEPGQFVPGRRLFTFLEREQASS